MSLYIVQLNQRLTYGDVVGTVMLWVLFLASWILQWIFYGFGVFFLWTIGLPVAAAIAWVISSAIFREKDCTSEEADLIQAILFAAFVALGVLLSALL